LVALLILTAIGFVALYTQTGFLQQDQIDTKDLQKWQYENGVIKNAQGFTLEGSSGKCWVMVHGYTSTPNELRIVARAVNQKFNDTVYVPRLDGHGTVPSDVERYSVDFWYDQIADIARRNNCSYLLGSSMGASLVLGFVETHHVDGAVLVGTPLDLEPSFLPTGLVVNALLPIARYTKRDVPGHTVQDPKGKAEHITGYTFPLKGVAELDVFNQHVKADLARVDSPVLFLHATHDTVANIKGAKDAYEKVGGSKRFIELGADHIVFRDYDKEKAVDAVLLFREQTKKQLPQQSS